jgi:hypothetical protein
MKHLLKMHKMNGPDSFCYGSVPWHHAKSLNAKSLIASLACCALTLGKQINFNALIDALGKSITSFITAKMAT